MRKPTVFISLGLLVTLGFLAGCSQTGNPTSASAPSAMTDSDLQQAVQSRLNADPELNAAKLDVDADARDNKVTLKGTVPTETMRLRAVDLAKAQNPNLEIADKIDVKPREISRSEYTEEMARERERRPKPRATNSELLSTMRGSTPRSPRN